MKTFRKMLLVFVVALSASWLVADAAMYLLHKDLPPHWIPRFTWFIDWMLSLKK